MRSRTTCLLCLWLLAALLLTKHAQAVDPVVVSVTVVAVNSTLEPNTGNGEPGTAVG